MTPKRKTILAGIETEGYLCNDGSTDILVVLTDIQEMNDSISATVTPHTLTPEGKTNWRRSIVCGDSEDDILRRYVKAQQNTLRKCITREELDSHLLKD